MDAKIKKKSLGQYFTGMPLAYLLSHICYDPSYKKIIDPMCGIGDMLFSYSGLNGDCNFFGIEIDPEFFDVLNSRAKESGNKSFSFFNGNAFDLQTLKKLANSLFDLTITNPPYVRYQTLSNDIKSEIPTLNAVEIRQNLLRFADILSFEDNTDKELFKILISNYSGLSDLAVPSWLLCAMLTRIGGTIALIVPETRLNRDYAQIVQYLLLRWFRIKYVIEDANSVWFPEAQVKTTLLIAERIPRKVSAFSHCAENFTHVSIRANSGNSQSIVGNLYPQNDCPEAVFVEKLRGGNLLESDYLSIRKVSLSQKAGLLRRKIRNSKWITLLEKHINSKITEKELVLPYAIQKWASDSKVGFKTLDDYGVKVGQGLRTGANKFFYVDINEELGDHWIVTPNKIFRERATKIKIPKSYLEKVIRRQDELDDGYWLNRRNINGGVLIFKDSVLPEDLDKIKKFRAEFQDAYSSLPAEISDFIRYASKKNIGSEQEPKFIPELSAVAPNAKPIDSLKNGTSPSFWYMLPPLVERHRPHLFIPRINNLNPRSILNSVPKTIIDANFSTIWTDSPVPKISEYALLSLLNSDWVYCLMELTATVMGGGALKLEASHIREIPLPELTLEQISVLDSLGRQLAIAENPKIIHMEINQFLIQVFFGTSDVSKKLDQLRQIMNKNYLKE